MLSQEPSALLLVIMAEPALGGGPPLSHWLPLQGQGTRHVWQATHDP